EVAELFSCYGLPLVQTVVASTPNEAGAAAARIGRPVALKATGPDLVHKTDVGAVRLGVPPMDAGDEARAMAAAIRAAGREVTGFMLQPMIEGGVEMLVGVANDGVFGPVLACGAGGSAV